MNKALFAVLMFVATSVQANGWDEKYVGQPQLQPQSMPFLSSNRELALWTLERLDLLPPTTRKAFGFKVESEKSGITTEVQYRINRHNVAIGLKITF